jgi:transposase
MRSGTASGDPTRRKRFAYFFGLAASRRAGRIAAYVLTDWPVMPGAVLRRLRLAPRRRVGHRNDPSSQIDPSFIGMEACGSPHYWARELKATGHDVLLMPPSYIKPYVKRGKNDAVDAEAICEAMSRPGCALFRSRARSSRPRHKTREAVGQAANDERQCAA